MQRLLLASLLVGCVDLGADPWDLSVPPAPPPPPVQVTDARATPNESDADASADAPCPHPGGPETAYVDIVSNRFEPKVIEICVGDTVIWENSDVKEHTVYSGTPEAPTGLIASRKLYRGDTFSFTFPTAGEILYYCSTHKKKMRDALVVVLGP